jgi:hypothetical protein
MESVMGFVETIKRQRKLKIKIISIMQYIPITIVDNIKITSRTHFISITDTGPIC